MQVIIDLNRDCEKYDEEYKEGVLKSELFGYKSFNVVGDDIHSQKFWLGNSRYYDCVLFESRKELHVFIK